MGCTSSSEQDTIKPVPAKKQSAAKKSRAPPKFHKVGEFVGQMSSEEVSFGVNFINCSGVQMSVFAVDNGNDQHACNLGPGQEYYFNSRKVGMQYKVKTPDGHVQGRYVSAQNYRSYNLTYQAPMVVLQPAYEYQSWLTFFNSTPFPCKLVFYQMPDVPNKPPPILVPSGGMFQTQTAYGQQVMVLRAMDNMYMFSAVASLVMVQTALTAVEIKQQFAAETTENNTRVVCRGKEADHYPCEKHYPRKRVTSGFGSELAMGAIMGLQCLMLASELDLDFEMPAINPQIPEGEFPDIEIPEGMAEVNLEDVFDNAGEVTGQAWDAAGNLAEDIDIGAAGEKFADAFEGMGDGLGGMMENAGDATGNIQDAAGNVYDAAAAAAAGIDFDAAKDMADQFADGAGEWAGQAFDAAGNLIEDVDVEGAVAGARDAAGNLIEQVDLEGARDAAGNLVEQVDLEGARDAAGNLLEDANLGERAGDLAERAGDLAENIDADAIIERAGDAAGGLLERAQELAENIDLGAVTEKLGELGDVVAEKLGDIDVGEMVENIQDAVQGD